MPKADRKSKSRKAAKDRIIRISKTRKRGLDFGDKLQLHGIWFHDVRWLGKFGVLKDRQIS